MRGVALALLAFLALTLAPTTPGPPAAGATSPDRGDRPDTIVVLPGASSAEGIAAGRGTTFYAGDYARGDIFRGDVRRRTAELFIDVPAGRQALGMVVDERHHLLFVAGGATGQAYVYDLDTGATQATYHLAPPDTSIVNDVALTRDGVWFTDIPPLRGRHPRILKRPPGAAAVDTRRRPQLQRRARRLDPHHL